MFLNVVDLMDMEVKKRHFIPGQQSSIQKLCIIGAQRFFYAPIFGLASKRKVFL